MFMATEITTGNLFTKLGFETPKFLAYLKTLPLNEAPFNADAVIAQLKHLVEMNNPKIDVEGAFSAMDSSSEAPAHTAPASPNTPISHVPQHDLESVFWLSWYGLTRANPKGHPPVAAGSPEQVSYDSFCNAMLSHTVGNTLDSRQGLMTNQLSFYEKTLHPQFKSLGTMLYWMGNYLQVPRDKWHPCTDTTYRYHVHDMMLLLLWAESVRIIASGAAEIPLDTEHPRPATRHTADVQVTATAVESRTTYSDWSDSQGVSVGQGAIPALGSGGQKRKRTAEAGDNVPNKRHSDDPPSSFTRHRQKMKEQRSNPEGSGGPSAPNVAMKKVPASFPQRKPQGKPLRKPRTSTTGPFQTRTEHNPRIVPNVPVGSVESDDTPMDESTEKEITMEIQSQTENLAREESEESLADVEALEAQMREQAPLPFDVASEMQLEMFHAERWFVLQAQKVN
jgi:hypothetical protein